MVLAVKGEEAEDMRVGRSWGITFLGTLFYQGNLPSPCRQAVRHGEIDSYIAPISTRRTDIKRQASARGLHEPLRATQA